MFVAAEGCKGGGGRVSVHVWRSSFFQAVRRRCPVKRSELVVFSARESGQRYQRAGPLLAPVSCIHVGRFALVPTLSTNSGCLSIAFLLRGKEDAIEALFNEVEYACLGATASHSPDLSSRRAADVGDISFRCSSS